MRLINKLYNLHLDEDIYVLCSGPSVDYISKDFFRNKTVISVNRSYSVFDIDICKYVIFQDYNEDIIEDVFNSAVNLIIPERAGGRNALKSFKEWEWFFFEREFPNYNSEQLFYFEHLENSVGELPNNLPWKDPKHLLINKCTTNSALHLAAHLGAANIILVGHDGGSLDGEVHSKTYWRQANEGDYREDYLDWMKGNLQLTSEIKTQLIKHFNVNIYSLNPFLSLALDGHILKKPGD